RNVFLEVALQARAGRHPRRRPAPCGAGRGTGCRLRTWAVPARWPQVRAYVINGGLLQSEGIVPFINFPAREINCKLVYYGPGLGGKTANLQWIYDHTGSNQKGKMVSLATETDRTLFFDFLPLDLGSV